MTPAAGTQPSPPASSPRAPSSSPAPAAPSPAPRGVVVRSEGQRQLISLGLSLATLERGLGGSVTRAAIHGWRIGTRSPGPRMRASLAAAYGIPPVAWTQLPLASPPDQRVVAQPQPQPQPSALVHASQVAGQVAGELAALEGQLAPGPAALAAPATTLDHASALLNQIRVERAHPDLLPSDRVRLADSEARALALRARLERDQLWFEDRIVREHPQWLKIRRELVRVLVQFPEAARAVADALAKLEA